MFQPTTYEAISHAVKKYQPAPGAQKMLNWEMQHAKESEETGIYVTYFCETK